MNERAKQMFKAALEGVANGYMEARRDIFYKGQRLPLAFFYRHGRIFGGFLPETYQAEKDAIEAALAAAENEAAENEARESWITWALIDRLVAHVGESWETGHAYYMLRARVPRDVWGAVGHHFEYVRRGEDDLEHPVTGWVIIGEKRADEVRRVLRDLAEKRADDVHRRAAEALRREAEEARRKAEAQERATARARAIVDQLHAAFQDAEVPEGWHRLDGSIIQNPLNPHNIYGGGEWWVITTDAIWYVQGNGRDGDDWSLNNVRTGGAGAIGRRLPRNAETKDLEALLFELQWLSKEVRS